MLHLLIAERTSSRISEVSQGFRHEDGSVDASTGTIQPKFDDDRVQNSLHGIPVAHNAASRLKCITNLTSCCGVCIRIVAYVGDRLIELAVSVTSYVGREGQSGFLVR